MEYTYPKACSLLIKSVFIGVWVYKDAANTDQLYLFNHTFLNKLPEI